MKRLSRILFLAGLCFFCNCKSPKNSGGDDSKSDGQPGITLKASIGGSIWRDTGSTIFIATTIKNTTSDTLLFMSMTCSYEDFFVTNNDSIRVQSRYDCYSNGPAVVSLPPHMSTDRYIMIVPTVKGVQLMDKAIKVGMRYSKVEKPADAKRIFEIYDKRYNDSLIWSDELYLDRLGKAVY